ncbi:MAG: hypothetical protein H6718_26695 [Polyangiaceae bacterium]|nr:hypothetical protein [Polyangiaceae bacterium]
MKVLRSVPLALLGALLLWVQVCWIANWFGYNTFVWLNVGSLEVCLGAHFHALHVSCSPPIPWGAASSSTYYHGYASGQLSHLGPLTASVEKVPTPGFLWWPEASFNGPRWVVNAPEWLALPLLGVLLLGALRLAGFVSKPSSLGAERVAPEG